jgi:hypothetical protein
MMSPVKIWRNQKKIRMLLNRKGKIISWTKIHVPPSGFESQAPYIVAVVKLDNGKKIVSQLVNWQSSDLKSGNNVVTILRKTRQASKESVIPYGIKCRPFN